MPSKALKSNLQNANKPVPQMKQADPRQVKNSEGGFVFEVSDKSRLERFLILGTDGGTYYISEKKLTDQNVEWLIKLIQRGNNDASVYWMIHNTIRDISTTGRAYRNSPAIFATALLLIHDNGVSFQEANGLWHQSKESTRELVSVVCRTSTHLFEFAEYVELLGSDAHDKRLADPRYAEAMKVQAEAQHKNPRQRFSGSVTGGWGKAKRRAIAQWYESKSPDSLAYQAVKYRQRNGWTHRDLFRLSHPKGVDQQVGNFILGKTENLEVPQGNVIYGFLNAQMLRPDDSRSLLAILDKHPNLPWEAVPTQFHKSPELWKKLFYNGQLQGQALLRQITRLAKLGLFNDMVFARDYANRLVDEEMIAKTRLHPMQYLLALIGHTEGQIPRASRGSFGDYSARTKEWMTSSILVDALNEGFYKAFKHVEPANKRTLIGVDVSSSMRSLAMGIDLSCAQVAAAMAMTIARTEPYYEIRGFTTSYAGYGRRGMQLTDLGITATTKLNDAMRKVQLSNFGGTDCSLPMEHAIQNNLAVDTFVVITDNETYAGVRHPHVALQDYRKKSGIDAKLVVMGVASNGFTIADPSDRGMLDVVGMDTNVPRIISDFSADRI